MMPAPKPIKVAFRLGTMTPRETAQQLITDLTEHIVKLRDDAHNRAKVTKTIKQARFHEGQVSMADSLSVFLAWIEIVE